MYFIYLIIAIRLNLFLRTYVAIYLLLLNAILDIDWYYFCIFLAGTVLLILLLISCVFYSQKHISQDSFLLRFCLLLNLLNALIRIMIRRFLRLMMIFLLLIKVSLFCPFSILLYFNGVWFLVVLFLSCNKKRNSFKCEKCFCFISYLYFWPNFRLINALC